AGPVRRRRGRRRGRVPPLLPALTAAPRAAGRSARDVSGPRTVRSRVGAHAEGCRRSPHPRARPSARGTLRGRAPEMNAAAAQGGRSALGRWITLPRALGAVVAAWTFVVFLPTVRNGFVEWDDVRMFLENPYHRGPWGMRLRGAWATHLLGEYMPVTWSSYALDRFLWDLDAGGYHLTSLVLHVLTALAVYAVARRLLGLARGARLDERGRALAAAVAARAFAVHPLRAEPVGRVSARGPVLGGLLLVLAEPAALACW